MASNKKRDPATDPDATVRDFVTRLRNIGYPGNVRVEFPIYTIEDVRWCAKLVDDANRELLALVRALGAAGRHPKTPLEFVLRARAIAQRLDQQMKHHTTHAEVQQMRRA
jgi:hypothetical protein